MMRNPSWLALSATLTLAACYQPDYRIRDFDELTDDAGVVTDAASEEGGSLAPEGLLHFKVLTKPQGGRYAPRNIGAIWIEDGSGKFVRTLEMWAKLRARYLRRFDKAASGDTTDAITSATLDLHRVHELSWDFRDRSGQIVPDGDYTVLVEVTDRDATGDSIAIPFKKASGEALPEIADTKHFLELALWREISTTTGP
jgi:hypothetical protein